MFENIIKTPLYALIASLINVLLYNIPLFELVYNTIELKTFNGVLLMASFIITAILLNFLLFYIAIYVFRIFGKWLLILFFIINSLCLYFINNYGVLIDSAMIGNIINTNYDEASSFFSLSIFLYFVDRTC